MNNLYLIKRRFTEEKEVNSIELTDMRSYFIDLFEKIIEKKIESNRGINVYLLNAYVYLECKYDSNIKIDEKITINKISDFIEKGAIDIFQFDDLTLGYNVDVYLFFKTSTAGFYHAKHDISIEKNFSKLRYFIVNRFGLEIINESVEDFVESIDKIIYDRYMAELEIVLSEISLSASEWIEL